MGTTTNVCLGMSTATICGASRHQILSNLVGKAFATHMTSERPPSRVTVCDAQRTEMTHCAHGNNDECVPGHVYCNNLRCIAAPNPEQPRRQGFRDSHDK
mmetsp:Transcript_11812/g.42250  ORF Transcript_11812/g.42250 Transcript_11812/m.42250 type:complete len:100 (+) Transcript_11812:54-353(+)